MRDGAEASEQRDSPLSPNHRVSRVCDRLRGELVSHQAPSSGAQLPETRRRPNAALNLLAAFAVVPRIYTHREIEAVERAFAAMPRIVKKPA